MPDISMADVARAACDLVLSRLPERCELVHIESGDQLMDKQIPKLLAGEDDVLNDEWLSDNVHHGIEYVVGELVDQDVRELLDTHELLDEVRDAVQERDQSDPLRDLMRETGPKLFRYRVDAEVDAPAHGMTDQELTEAAQRLGAAVGVDTADFHTNLLRLRKLVVNSIYGGCLYVLWRGDLAPLYDAVCKVRFHEPTPTVMVEWKDPELLLLDRVNGTGWTERIEGTIRLPFDPDQVTLDAGRYSWSDVVGDSHYMPESDAEPTFEETAPAPVEAAA